MILYIKINIYSYEQWAGYLDDNLDEHLEEKRSDEQLYEYLNLHFNGDKCLLRWAFIWTFRRWFIWTFMNIFMNIQTFLSLAQPQLFFYGCCPTGRGRHNVVKISVCLSVCLSCHFNLCLND